MKSGPEKKYILIQIYVQMSALIFVASLKKQKKDIFYLSIQLKLKSSVQRIPQSNYINGGFLLSVSEGVPPLDKGPARTPIPLVF